jgi:hypothetical protein
MKTMFGRLTEVVGRTPAPPLGTSHKIIAIAIETAAASPAPARANPLLNSSFQAASKVR